MRQSSSATGCDRLASTPSEAAITIRLVRALQTRAPSVVQIVSTLEELTAWVDAWRELAEERGNPFITPEWYSAWLEHYGDDAEPFAIVSGTPDGSCQGVLPLVRSRGSRVLRFAGADLGDHFQPACRAEDEVAFAQAACAILREREDAWSTAVFHGTQVGSAWHSALCDSARPLAVVTGPATAMPYVDLTGVEWNQFWAERGRKLRKYVRSRTNQVEGNHEVGYRQTHEPSELDADMSVMLELHEQRFGESSLLLDPTAQAFHRSFAAAALAQDWLRLVFMELDGKPVAASYGWNVGGRYGDYNGGFAPEWAKTSVGLLLMVHTLRSALEQGATEYDFLLGDEAYKSRFTSSRREVATVLVAPRLHPQRLMFSAGVQARKLMGRLPGSTGEQLQRSLRPLMRRLPTTRSG